MPEFRTYLRQDLRHDLVAGLTTAVLDVPQSMAYALIAGLPPVFGLYTSIVGAIVGSVFGHSSHVITGATNASALLFAGVLGAYSGPLSPMEAVFVLTLLTGGIKLAFGLLRLGWLVNYISEAVLLGFLAGAAVLIVRGQAASFLGIAEAVTADPRWTLPMLDAQWLVHWPTLALAVATLVTILIAKTITERIPAPLIAVVLAALTAWLLNLSDTGVALIRDLGGIEGAWPGIASVPGHVGSWTALLGGAAALAMLGLMETTSASKSIALLSGQRTNSNREFVAHGIVNITGAFFHNFTASASLTRSMVNYRAGARTRAAGLFSGLFVALMALFGSTLLGYIPLAALAAVLFVVAGQMIAMERIRYALRVGTDSRAALGVTFVGTLFLRLDLAVALGVTLSLLLFLRRLGSLRISLLRPAGEEGFLEVPFEEEHLNELRGGIAIVNVIGPLYFGDVDQFMREARSVVRQRPRVLILRFRRVSHIDGSGLRALETFCDELEAAGISLILCGVDHALVHVLDRAGLLNRIGADRVVISNDLLFNSMEVSMALAASLQEHEE
ncbi:MAG: SulP family inorganic anion transporter [Candidatus Hydrogenedentes bacterium]|nr:SulP family inorganic anion transporter [Candidatus Hydrogenedentota bacterium]